MKTLMKMITLLFSTATLAVGLSDHEDPYFGNEQGMTFECESERNTLGLGDQYDPFSVADSGMDSMDSMDSDMSMSETQVCMIRERDIYNPYFG